MGRALRRLLARLVAGADTQLLRTAGGPILSSGVQPPGLQGRTREKRCTLGFPLQDRSSPSKRGGFSRPAVSGEGAEADLWQGSWKSLAHTLGRGFCFSCRCPAVSPLPLLSPPAVGAWTLVELLPRPFSSLAPPPPFLVQSPLERKKRPTARRGRPGGSEPQGYLAQSQNSSVGHTDYSVKGRDLEMNWPEGQLTRKKQASTEVEQPLAGDPSGRRAATPCPTMRRRQIRDSVSRSNDKG
ncbi:uncharacterized protein LOC122464534 [Chelonia mydas]|uniref:uncharacterized protein LOC122464534 n=1 Tax=Chelonia mydas TaxID=8469 RepID=UPI001CA93706|nr:uncharacterized protein LOC122464534 [Chelonia mydas]